MLHPVGMRHDFDAVGFTELELAFFKRGERLEEAASVEAWEDDDEWEWEIAIAAARQAA